VCLSKDAECCPVFHSAEWFAINVLGADDEATATRFAKRGADKFAGFWCEIDQHGSPLLPCAAATLTCQRYNLYDCGDHIVLVGRVVATRLGSEEGPLVYSGRRFGRFAVGRESGLDPIDTRNNSIRHCIQCGSSVVSATLQGDVVVRPICRQCGHVHYVNSTVVVGCVTETRDGRILMCKRRISPRKGYWTFPSGFLECGESGPEGARRETLEEACAEVHIDGLLCVIDVPQMSEVHLVYRGLLLPSTLSATPESSEVALVAEADVAWQDLAFTSIRESLRCFFEDRRAKRRRAHMLDLRAAPPDDNRDEILPVVALNGSTGDPPAAEVSSKCGSTR